MFGIGRRKTHRDLVKAELGESFDHFVQAATHAAGGVGATVGPRIGAARGYVGPTADRVRDTASRGWGSTLTAFAPIAAAAAEGARQAGTAAKRAKSNSLRPTRKKESLMARKRWSILTGLLAAGAVAGAVGAVAARRRRSREWNSYDPAETLPAMDRGTDTIGAAAAEQPRRDLPGSTPAPSAGTAPTGTPADLAKSGTAKQKAAGASDKLSSATSSITESAKQSAAKTTDKTDGLLGGATTQSGNSRG